MNAAARLGLALALLGSGCAPALDWREVHPGDSGVVAMFPCKPVSHARRVPLAGQLLRLELHACSASGATWALAFAEVDDPARITPVLDALRQAAAANLDGATSTIGPLQVPGATPNRSSVELRVRGRAPDGRERQERIGLFTKGLRVYQATVLAEQVDTEAAATFFGSLRVQP